MAADWSRLERALRDVSGDSVTFTWAELDQMVGGMPASAVDHVAWWSGDRPHTRAWKRAGFRVDPRPWRAGEVRAGSCSGVAAEPYDVCRRGIDP